MATLFPVNIKHGHDGGADLFEWRDVVTGSPLMSAGDTIGWLHLPVKADKSVHVYGAFGGTVAIEGTLEDTPANPITLTDPGGTLLTFTTTGLRSVLQPVLQIRPSPGAGVSATTVRLLAVRP
jgi:hypothetical protein